MPGINLATKFTMEMDAFQNNLSLFELTPKRFYNGWSRTVGYLSSYAASPIDYVQTLYEIQCPLWIEL